MKKRFALLLFFLTFAPVSLWAQATDLDQLLRDGFEDVRQQRFQSALEKGRQGIAASPDYLDFYLLAGRASQRLGQFDEARRYLQTVIDRNPEYEEAWSFLIETEQQSNRPDKAMELADRAIATHPDSREFRIKKLELYQMMRDERSEYDYVQTLRETYPNDETVTQRYLYLQAQRDNDRFGLHYAYTSIDRDGYGPWHLGSVQYIRERNWGSLIGRVGYADRRAHGESVADGLQYEAESYIFSGRSSYHYAGIAYSDDVVFPKWRAGYSFFHNYRKGWESDFGARYTQAGDRDFYTAVVGGGKYLGSYWINLRAFLQFEEDDFYPAFTLTTRYYFDTRFDYVQLTAGYGTSPDDRPALGQFDQRVGLQSWRGSLGYFRIFGNHWITGVNLGVNRQEYVPAKRQTELELALMLQYRL